MSTEDEFCRRLGLGHDSEAIRIAMVAVHGIEWVEERAIALANPYRDLDLEIRRQLTLRSSKANRESASQKRLRIEREKEEAVELGLADPDSTQGDVAKISAFTWLTARMDREIRRLKKETIEEFLTDLLVPQKVPGDGWKRRADLTREDCLTIANDYRKKGTTETAMAFAFASFADAISSQGVITLGEVDLSSLRTA